MANLGNIDLKELRGAQFPTDGDLVACIHPKLKQDEFGSGGPPSAESLRIYFSKLANHEETKWWENHPSATKALAECLQIPVEDLPFWRGRPSDDSLIAFTEFPQLPPLNPRTEEPCRLAAFDDGSQDHSALHGMIWHFHWHEPPSTLNSESRWLRVPDGGGKRFVAKYHRLASAYEVHELDDLEQADALLGADSPLLIRLEHPADNRAAIEVAEQLAAHPHSVVVLASFRPPGMSEDTFSKRSSTRHAESGRWICRQWRPGVDMREKLVRWVEQRLHDYDKAGIFEARSVIDWLDKHDPDAHLFSTPSDVLTICREAFDGPKKLHALTTDKFAQRWIRRRLNMRGTSRAASLRSELALDEVVRRLVCDWFHDTSLPWEGALTRRQWQQLVARAADVPADDTLDKDELYQRLRVTNDSQEREDIIDTLQASDRAGADALVRALIEVGLLQWKDPNHLTAGPRWLLVAFAKAEVTQLVREDSLVGWARLAARADRQSYVDLGWRSLPTDECARRLEDVLEQTDTDTLVGTAALETLFGVVADRLPRGDDFTEDLLHRLIDRCHQIWANSLFMDVAHEAPGPLTRRSPAGAGRYTLLHLLHCWTISHKVAPPPAVDLDGFEWLFPAWTTGAMPSQPSWMLVVDTALHRARHSPASATLTPHGTHLFYEVTLDAVRHLRGRVDAWPDFMVPAVLVDTPDDVDPDDLRSALDVPHVSTWLTAKLDEMSGDRREAAARAIWRALMPKSALRPDHFLQGIEQLGPLEPAVLASVSMETLFANYLETYAEHFGLGAATLDSFLRKLDPPPTSFESPVPADLVESLRKWVFQWVLQHHKDWLGELARHFVDELQPEPAIIDLLAQNDKFYDFQRDLWHKAPHKAYRFATKHYESSPESMEVKRWFLFSPTEQVDALFEHVRHRSAHEPPEWVKRWTADRLPFARASAEEMWEWLRA